MFKGNNKDTRTTPGSMRVIHSSACELVLVINFEERFVADMIKEVFNGCINLCSCSTHLDAYIKQFINTLNVFKVNNKN